MGQGEGEGGMPFPENGVQLPPNTAASQTGRETDTAETAFSS